MSVTWNIGSKLRRALLNSTKVRHRSERPMTVLRVLTQKRAFAAAIAFITLMLVPLLACQSSPPAPTNTVNPVADFVTAVEQALPSVVILEVEFGPQGAPQ